MINNSQPMAESQRSDEVVIVAPTFYVVSRKKLAILYIATLGMYSVYWFYKNWSNYKNRMSDKFDDDRSIWPVPRGIFAIFFTHALFREVKAYGDDNATVSEWNNESQATKLVLTMIVSNVLDRLSYRSIGSPYTDIASILILAPLLAQLLSAQQMINASCGDPNGESNSRFTVANYAWIVLGLLIWILVIFGIFSPG
ncbi:hypothetical protein [Undibacterium sp. TS12]|uniref:hypothetical protein n=1 Tax=Undibacterium sp. TS12 TaxID=2908202 RepID=UPI001F4D133A|nr:hypothetical protein [Undibacterium sp. TS12]MCH8617911.1 hypothetical protein [Undibacterium sp. TS12]